MADAHDAPHLLRSRRKDYGLRHDAEIGEAVTLVNPELFFPGNQAGGAYDGSIFLKNTRVHAASNLEMSAPAWRRGLVEPLGQFPYFTGGDGIIPGKTYAWSRQIMPMRAASTIECQKTLRKIGPRA
jgi:hypothetical protein